MRRDVAEFVKTCMVSQQAKSSHTHIGDLLQFHREFGKTLLWTCSLVFLFLRASQ